MVSNSGLIAFRLPLFLGELKTLVWVNEIFLKLGKLNYVYTSFTAYAERIIYDNSTLLSGPIIYFEWAFGDLNSRPGKDQSDSFVVFPKGVVVLDNLDPPCHRDIQQMRYYNTCFDGFSNIYNYSSNSYKIIEADMIWCSI